jgi:acetyl esterase/lipase
MKRLSFAIVLAASSTLAAAETADPWLARPVDDRTFKTYLEFFTYDTRLPFDVRAEKPQEDEGLVKERLSFQSTPGVRVTAVLSRPSAAGTGKRPAVILLHGGGPRGKDNPNTATMASFLARAGFLVFAIDLPYFGERATDLLTTFSEEEKHQKLYNQPSAYLAWVTQTVKDVRRSYDLIVEERGADPAKVAILGISRGAIESSIAGAIETRFAAVALLFAGHFDALEKSHLPSACPANYIGRIAPRPLLMINAKQDSDMIKDRAVEPLYKLAKQPKEIIWTEGGHGFMEEEHRAALVQWLREKLR